MAIVECPYCTLDRMSLIAEKENESIFYLGFCIDICSLLQKEVDHFHVSIVTSHD